MPNYSLPATSTFFKGILYQQMHDDLHLAGMAERTIHGYLRSVRQLADFCQCSPDQVTEQQLRQWLLHLKIEKQFAYGSLRVAFSGVKFFFTRTCRREWRTLAETKLQNIKTLAEVLTRRQVHLVIDTCTTVRMATFFWTVYSLGLRLDEGVNLQVGDIDGQRMMVHIHRGKGAKDLVPGGGVSADGKQWLQVRPDQLFHPLPAMMLYKKLFVEAIKRAGLYSKLPYGVLKKNWVVNIRPVGNGGAVLKYLAPYVYRVAISDNRIQEVNSDGVTYRIKPTGKNRWVTRHATGDQFVASFAQHILPSGFQKIRYYGWMSPNCKLQLANVRWLVWLYRGWTYWLGSAMSQSKTEKPKPPGCRHCRGEMELLAITNEVGPIWCRPQITVRGPPCAA